METKAESYLFMFARFFSLQFWPHGSLALALDAAEVTKFLRLFLRPREEVRRRERLSGEK